MGWDVEVVTIDVRGDPFTARAEAFLRGKIADRIEHVEGGECARLWFADDWYLEFELWEDEDEDARGYPVLSGHGLCILLGKKGGFDLNAWLTSGKGGE